MISYCLAKKSYLTKAILTSLVCILLIYLGAPKVIIEESLYSASGTIFAFSSVIFLCSYYIFFNNEAMEWLNNIDGKSKIS